MCHCKTDPIFHRVTRIFLCQVFNALRSKQISYQLYLDHFPSPCKRERIFDPPDDDARHYHCVLHVDARRETARVVSHVAYK